jgi:hypothetical protein
MKEGFSPNSFSPEGMHSGRGSTLIVVVFGGRVSGISGTGYS